MLAIGLSIVALVGLWFVIAKLTGHRLGKGAVLAVVVALGLIGISLITFFSMPT
ncbi:hypothetical protein YK48G_10460 [Lentilactobacillus fungorum]|uniref:Uncharacterized protein n=1 Tax=Lentilactobacillus fungorum TaxID=2201250 RepID=A0ABQ3VZI8_9LACO|nr:hypothetical protein [Lentilactobacillus fungorum]GHP13621.1 hypothetical protein YK48G_10460 [Lentilactobacillus fungorum]